MTAWLFAVSGVAVGMGQAALLARAAHGRPHALSALIRFTLVGAVLVLAARFGQLACAVAGWLAGFVLAGVRVYRRLQ
jgi:hypothetical protein